MIHDYLKNNNISIQNEIDVIFRHCVLTDRDSMVHYPPDAEFHKVYFIQGHQRPNDGSKASIRRPDRRNYFDGLKRFKDKRNSKYPKIHKS